MKVEDLRQQIVDELTLILKVKERMYYRTVQARLDNATSDEEVDLAEVDLRESTIKLAYAKVDLAIVRQTGGL